MPYLPITDHGLIGDLHTAGLVGLDGRLVWLPWPHFNSPSLFAAILDDANGGDWLLAPTQVTSVRQAYAGQTAVLVTYFQTPTGSVELWDWMSPFEGETSGHDLCRQLRCTAGEVEICGRIAPRPDYARQPVVLQPHADGFQFTAHGLTMYVASDQPWQLAEHEATLSVRLRAGEQLHCVLSSGPEYVPVHRVAADLEATQGFWRQWIQTCTYTGNYADLVLRSAITLKLLTYSPSGAIIAAPTASLPEWIGGVRNWDYRYTWLRDASFTLSALCSLGYHQEEGAFFNWLNDLAEQHETPLQIMYGINGETELREIELPHLEGYRGSAPVRIGNGAYNQRQLDVYGGILDAALAYEHHLNRLSPQQWSALQNEIDYVVAHWHEPDQGIWEMRGPPQQHTFSKLMCWVTVDRGIALAEHEGWTYDKTCWHETRDAIRESILAHAWDKELGSFTQTYESKHVDASLLVLPLIGFLPATDPRVLGTIDRIKTDLAEGPLVYRYRADDGLSGGEGAFLLCSFWLVEALLVSGQVVEARERFEALLRYASPHGLFAEEVEPATGMALGNYPQAFSHIGLINSALRLAKAEQQLRATDSGN